ncbi:uncharacterized protein SRS1_11354 [Sporisorium reilianum f. sp. reilianum]|uniref:Uncharacterized protein n=1 Tax=Sporisorium reilianum f. sp. reilianum TaxID=72559 RepID=A0A2N8UPH4_9BASI|nr:uncharacterized protein SRS1_11354 [Sporisorium reilianum f. sp. reilianum]
MKLNTCFVALALASSALTFAAPLPVPGWTSIGRKVGKFVTGGSSSRRAAESSTRDLGEESFHHSGSRDAGEEGGRYHFTTDPAASGAPPTRAPPGIPGSQGSHHGDHGYASPPPPPSQHGGYGGFAPPPPSQHGGYGGFAPPPPSQHGGYGGFAPPPPQHGGYVGYPPPPRSPPRPHYGMQIVGHEYPPARASDEHAFEHAHYPTNQHQDGGGLYPATPADRPYVPFRYTDSPAPAHGSSGYFDPFRPHQPEPEPEASHGSILSETFYPYKPSEHSPFPSDHYWQDRK